MAIIHLTNMWPEYICFGITTICLIGTGFLFGRAIGKTYHCKATTHVYFWLCLMSLLVSLMAFSICSSIVNALYVISLYSDGPALEAMLFVARPAVSFANGLVLALLITIAIERTTATKFYRTYERHTNAKRPIFIIFTLIFASGVLDVYCWNFSNIDFNILAAIYYTSYISCALTLCICLRINKKLKHINDRSIIVLSHRYQVQENIRTLRFGMPIIVASCLGLLVSGLLSILAHFIPKLQANTVFDNVLYNTANCTFIFAAFLYFTYHQIRFDSATVAPAEEKDLHAQAITNSDRHFNQMKQVW